MIETYILQNLVAFADSGTLVAASEIVNVTQPSLTRFISTLALHSYARVARFGTPAVGGRPYNP